MHKILPVFVLLLTAYTPLSFGQSRINSSELVVLHVKADSDTNSTEVLLPKRISLKDTETLELPERMTDGGRRYQGTYLTITELKVSDTKITSTAKTYKWGSKERRLDERGDNSWKKPVRIFIAEIPFKKEQNQLVITRVRVREKNEYLEQRYEAYLDSPVILHLMDK